MSNNMFNKILSEHATWLNGLPLFSNKISGKHYNKQTSAMKQVTPPPEIKNYDF